MAAACVVVGQLGVIPAAAPWLYTRGSPPLRQRQASVRLRTTISAYQPSASPARTSVTTQLVDGRNGSTEIAENLRSSPFSLLASLVAVGACAVIGFSSPRLEAAKAEEGALADSGATFQRTCAGCHAGGGNVLQPNATLFAKDLDRNGLASVDEIFQITYAGKGRMPGYGEKCAPRGQCTFGPRLSDADIRALAEFVRLQADQGWPK